MEKAGIKLYVDNDKVKLTQEKYAAMQGLIEDWGIQHGLLKNEVNSNSSGASTEAFMLTPEGLDDEKFAALYNKVLKMHTDLEQAELDIKALLNRVEEFYEILGGEEFSGGVDYLNQGEPSEKVAFLDTSYQPGIVSSSTLIYVQTAREQTALDSCCDLLAGLKKVSVAYGEDKSTIEESMKKQKYVGPLCGAYTQYVSAVGVFNEDMSATFDAISENEYVPVTSRAYDFDEMSIAGCDQVVITSIKNEVIDEYILSEEGRAKIQDAVDNWDNQSDAGKKFIVWLYTVSADTVAESFDENECESYKKTMEIILTGFMISTFRANSETGYETVFDVSLDNDRVKFFLSNLDENSEAYKILKVFCSYGIFKNEEFYSSEPDAKCSISLDKAGIAISITSSFPNANLLLGQSNKDVTYDYYYTSQERSLLYIDYMIEQDSSYADHLMNDVGCSKDQLAALLTAAQNHYDMEQLDNLVNANDDYSNVFTVDTSELSDSCGNALAEFSFNLMYDYDEIPRNEYEFTKFSDAILNATFETDGFVRTEQLLDIMITASSRYNDVCIAGYFLDNCEENRSALLLSNGLYSYWGNLSYYYENELSYDLSVFSSTQSHIHLSVVNSYINAEGETVTLDFYNDTTGEFSFLIEGKLVGEGVSEDNDVSLSSPYYNDPFITSGVYEDSEARTEQAERRLKQIMQEAEEAQRGLAIDSVIDLVSVFNPKLGGALELAKQIKEAEIRDMIKSGQSFDEDKDILNDLVEDPMVIYELESTNYSAETIQTLLEQGKLVFNVASVIGDYVIGMNEEQQKVYDTAKENINLLALDEIYSYNNGTGEGKLCSPEAIDFVNNWNEQGCNYFVDEGLVSTYSGKVYTDDGKLTAEILGHVAFFFGVREESSKGWDDDDCAAALKDIENASGYTEEEILSAYDVIFNGSASENESTSDSATEYSTIQDIPADLLTVCIQSLDEAVKDAPKNFTEQLKDKLDK